MNSRWLSVVVFKVAEQLFALPAADVRELVHAVAIVPLPSAPAVVEGVIDLRGKIVPVLDIRSRFGLPARPVAPSDHLLIASAGEFLVAVRADRAVDLVGPAKGVARAGARARCGRHPDRRELPALHRRIRAPGGQQLVAANHRTAH